MTRFLITGGAGFIGSHLADALVARGDSVLVLDDLSTGRMENLESAIPSGRCRFVEGCTEDEDLVDTLMADADACFHLASAVGVELIVDRPYESLMRNVRGCDVMLHAAARHGVRLLLASTSEVYGKHSKGSLNEHSDRLLGPPQLSRWSYATAKSFGETLAYGLCEAQGAAITVARLFNTTGPRQTGAYGMVLPRFVRQALAVEDLTVYGDGTQSRCFAHVGDIVRGLVALIEADAAIGRPFNIGAPRETEIVDLARLVIERTESVSNIDFISFEDAYGDGFEELGRRSPDTSALESLAGWRPRFTLEQTIDDVIAFERSHAAERAHVPLSHSNGNRHGLNHLPASVASARCG